MKALVLEAKNAPFVIKEVEIPSLDKDEILIKIKSSAFNHRDVWIQKGMYAGLKYPCILGSDGSGTVEKVGDEVVNSFLNNEVIINPGFNWGDNQNVQKADFKILGLPDDGTFAQYVKVNKNYVYQKPANLSFDEAAAIPLSGLTAYRALFSRANIQKGDKVLISGIGGGTALFAFQFALTFGAEVYVTSGSDDKINKAIEMGAKGGANYKKENWEKEFKVTFDVIVDSAAGDGFAKLVDLASPGGRIVFYGGTKGTINNLNPQKIFWKQLSILGSTMGSDKDFKDMLEFIEKHNIKPVVDKVYNFEQGQEAIERMANADQFGKIVLNF